MIELTLKGPTRAERFTKARLLLLLFVKVSIQVHEPRRKPKPVRCNEISNIGLVRLEYREELFFGFEVDELVCKALLELGVWIVVA